MNDDEIINFDNLGNHEPQRLGYFSMEETYLRSRKMIETYEGVMRAAREANDFAALKSVIISGIEAVTHDFQQLVDGIEGGATKLRLEQLKDYYERWR